MTKEELIALSDLNREDNIKYISSEAQGIAITLDSDRYAPTLCKLERAYICGRRKSEEQIAELEKQIEKMKWHILAEEPNILPKEGQKVRVLTEEGTIEESTLFYDTYYEELAWSNIGLVRVFAWCEIPKEIKEND